MAKYNNEELLKKFGLEIMLYRYSKGITQKEFADMLGVTRQYLSEVEKGHELINMPTFINLVKISKKYGQYSKCGENKKICNACYGNLMSKRNPQKNT